MTNLCTNLTPSLPQRIRKRINQIHKPQSFEVDDGSPGPPQPPTSEKSRLFADERTNQKSGFEQPAVKYGGEAANLKPNSSFDVVELVFNRLLSSLIGQNFVFAWDETVQLYLHHDRREPKLVMNWTCKKTSDNFSIIMIHPFWRRLTSHRKVTHL